MDSSGDLLLAGVFGSWLAIVSFQSFGKGTITRDIGTFAGAWNPLFLSFGADTQYDGTEVAGKFRSGTGRQESFYASSV